MVFGKEVINMGDAITSALGAFSSVFTWMLSNPYCLTILGAMVCGIVASIIAGIFR